MSDKFPKQYVLDRIEARLGRLELKINEDQSTLDTFRAGQVAALDKILATNLDRIEALNAKVKLAKREYERAETYVAKKKALEPISGNALSLESTPYAYRNTHRKGAGGSGRTEGDIVDDIAGYKREQTDLLHAKVYLTGMPVDEFSLASLKSLGLMSILKFNILEAVEA